MIPAATLTFKKSRDAESQETEFTISTTKKIRKGKAMNWKFWQKENHSSNSHVANEIKLAKPRELPERVGFYLVTQLKLDPDWVWSLKCALRPIPDEKNDFEIRIFNPASAASKGVNVLNYNSLDLHRDMILFSGSFNRKSGQVLIEYPLKKVA